MNKPKEINQKTNTTNKGWLQVTCATCCKSHVQHVASHMCDMLIAVCPGSEGDLWPASAMSLCPGVFFIHLEAGRQPGCPATQLQHKLVQGWNNRRTKTENMVSTVRNNSITTSRKYQMKPVHGCINLLPCWDQIINNLYWYLWVKSRISSNINRPHLVSEKLLTRLTKIVIFSPIHDWQRYKNTAWYSLSRWCWFV